MSINKVEGINTISFDAAGVRYSNPFFRLTMLTLQNSSDATVRSRIASPYYGIAPTTMFNENEPVSGPFTLEEEVEYLPSAEVPNGSDDFDYTFYPVISFSLLRIAAAFTKKFWL